MNEIKAADVNTGYGARGVPAFTCRFVAEERREVAVRCRFGQKSGKKKPPAVMPVAFRGAW